MDLNKILAIILETFLEFIHGGFGGQLWGIWKDTYNIQTNLNEKCLLSTQILKKVN